MVIRKGVVHPFLRSFPPILQGKRDRKPCLPFALLQDGKSMHAAAAAVLIHPNRLLRQEQAANILHFITIGMSNNIQSHRLSHIRVCPALGFQRGFRAVPGQNRIFSFQIAQPAQGTPKRRPVPTGKIGPADAACEQRIPG